MTTDPEGGDSPAPSSDPPPRPRPNGSETSPSGRLIITSGRAVFLPILSRTLTL